MASIQKRPNGKYRARYRDEEGKEHARHFTYKNNPNKPQESAQHWLDEVTASILTGRYIDPRAGRMTVEEFFNDWEQRQIWAPGTRRSARVAMRSCTFKTIEVRAVRRSHVETWVKSMESTGLAPSTMRTRMRNIRSVLRAAVRDRLLASDPSEGVPLPRERRQEHALQIPTTEQVGRLLASAPDQMRTFIALCAFAGLRRGEASAIRLGDVDFLGRQIHVRHQLRADDAGGSELVPPKYGSERRVFVPETLLRLVNEHASNFGTFGAEQFLFSAGTGRPPSPASVAKWWKAASEAAGVKGVRLHDLRHYFASGLIAAGCDVVTVQKALGHSKPTTTLNTYSHLWPTAEDKTRAAVGDLLNAALASADSERTASPVIVAT